MAAAPETMRSSRAGFATVIHALIDLPEQVLVMIVSRALNVIPATAGADGADERSLYAGMMRGIGSASKLWRHLVKGVLMGDELAWLRVPGAAAAAECMSCFQRALSLRIVGDARARDIGAVLGSRSVMRLALKTNNVMRGCEGLGQLVGLRWMPEEHDAVTVEPVSDGELLFRWYLGGVPESCDGSEPLHPGDDACHDRRGMVLIVEEDSDGSRGSWIIRCGSLDPFWGRKCQHEVAERPGISFDLRESHYNGCYNEP